MRGRALKNYFNARLWDKINVYDLNERQRKMIDMLLHEFEGELTSCKWVKIHRDNDYLQLPLTESEASANASERFFD